MEEFGGGQDDQCSLHNKAARSYAVCLVLNGAVLGRNLIDAQTLVVLADMLVEVLVEVLAEALVEVLVEVYHCSQLWPKSEVCAGDIQQVATVKEQHSTFVNAGFGNFLKNHLVISQTGHKRDFGLCKHRHVFLVLLCP